MVDRERPRRGEPHGRERGHGRKKNPGVEAAAGVGINQKAGKQAPQKSFHLHFDNVFPRVERVSGLEMVGDCGGD
jgi:hypothetical protein